MDLFAEPSDRGQMSPAVTFLKFFIKEFYIVEDLRSQSSPFFVDLRLIFVDKVSIFGSFSFRFTFSVNISFNCIGRFF